MRRRVNRDRRNDERDAEEHNPTRQDIRDACQEIQAGWSDSERRKRAGLPKVSYWNPPTFQANQFGHLESESEA